MALCQGAAARGPTAGLALRIGFAFGLAQGVMPLLGWGVGRIVQGAIGPWNAWLAFAILLVLGARMLATGLRHGAESDEAPTALTGSWTLAGLAVATSIDAAAAGLALDAMGLAPLIAAGVIALVTALLCAGGVYLGATFKAALGGRAEVLGGLVLIGLAVKTLIDQGLTTG